jgi:hypothetical protein
MRVWDESSGHAPETTSEDISALTEIPTEVGAGRCRYRQATKKRGLMGV